MLHFAQAVHSEDLKRLEAKNATRPPIHCVLGDCAEAQSRRHNEEWMCGSARINLSRKDENPRFDRQLEVFLRLSPSEVDLDTLEWRRRVKDQSCIY